MPAPETKSEIPALEMARVDVCDLNNTEKIVLENVNWSARAGDYWVIGGLHGSGKGNFLFVAAGVLPPAKGMYRVFGTELSAGYEQERVTQRLRIGTVFDGGRLLHDLSLVENIALPLRYHRDL